MERGIISDRHSLFKQSRENPSTLLYDSFDLSKSMGTIHLLDYDISGLRSRFVTGDWTTAASRHERRVTCSSLEKEKPKKMKMSLTVMKLTSTLWISRPAECSAQLQHSTMTNVRTTQCHINIIEQTKNADRMKKF